MMTIICNTDPNLRLVSVWFDAAGNVAAADQSIVGWRISNDAPYPTPIPAGGHPAHVVVERLVHDRAAGTWMDQRGVVYRDWKSVVTPIYARREASDARLTPNVLPFDWSVDHAPTTPPKGASAGKPGPSSPGGLSPRQRRRN